MRQLSRLATTVVFLILPLSAGAGTVTTTWTLEATSVVDLAGITGLSTGSTFEIVFTTDAQDLAGSDFTGLYDIVSQLYVFPAGTLVATSGFGRLRVSNGTGGGSGSDDEYIVNGDVGGMLGGVQTNVDTRAGGFDGVLVWLLDSSATALQSDDVPLDLELAGFDSVFSPELSVFNGIDDATIVTQLVSVSAVPEASPVPTMSGWALLVLASLLLAMGRTGLMRVRGTR